MNRGNAPLTITPREGCPYCRGTGTVYDTVDWWGATAQMPSTCDCVLEQLPDNYEDDYEIKPAPGAYPDEDAELERALTGEGER